MTKFSNICAKYQRNYVYSNTRFLKQKIKQFRQFSTTPIIQIGGKAKGLDLLTKTETSLFAHTTVPKANYVIIDNVYDDVKFNAFLKSVPDITHDKLYAVRSSAAVEDGSNKSYAGHFKTELGVSYDYLHTAAKKVADSYGSNKEASSVIIQEFINSKKGSN